VVAVGNLTVGAGRRRSSSCSHANCARGGGSSLSRGYGGRPAAPTFVSTARARSSPPLKLGRAAFSAAATEVLAGHARYRAGHGRRPFRVDVLLDDGFQQRRLHADVDIVRPTPGAVGHQFSHAVLRSAGGAAGRTCWC
jgi:tetraacyldisaccharide-1-P 4'-kinase